MRAAFEGLDEAFEELLAGLDAEMPEAVTACAKLTADEAARSHPYVNRSRQLETHTVPGVTDGVFSAGTLHGEAVGDTPYARFVDEGTPRARAFPFLAPAAERAEGDASRELDQGAARAGRRAGWGT